VASNEWPDSFCTFRLLAWLSIVVGELAGKVLRFAQRLSFFFRHSQRSLKVATICPMPVLRVLNRPAGYSVLNSRITVAGQESVIHR